MPMATKEEQRDYQRQWMQRRRAEFFSDKNCLKCGSVERLELDHVDRATKVTHSIWSWSESRRLTEIAKCQVLWHDCHWEKTKVDLGYGLQHGTSNGYSYYKCRCDLCKGAAVQKNRDYRTRKRAEQEAVT